MPAKGPAKTIAEPHADTDGHAHARNTTTSNPRKVSAMPMIDVTALAGTDARISAVTSSTHSYA